MKYIPDYLVQNQVEWQQKQEEKIGKTIFPMPTEFTDLELCNENQLKSILQIMQSECPWTDETIVRVSEESGMSVTNRGCFYKEKEYFASKEEAKAEAKKLISAAMQSKLREYQLLQELMKLTD